MNLSKAVAVFLRSKPNLRTRKAYRLCLEPMVEYIGPARPIEKVTALDVVEYVATIHERDIAHATKRKHIITVKTFFNYLVSIDVLEKSPAKSVRTPRRKSNSRQKAMKDDEYDKLLDYAKRSSPRNYAMLLFLGDTV